MKYLLSILAVVLMTGCTTLRDTYPGRPYFLPDNTSLTAQEFAFDMPRTFDSGSCIAQGDTLLYRLPQRWWYCKTSYGLNSYHIELLEPDR